MIKRFLGWILKIVGIITFFFGVISLIFDHGATYSLAAEIIVTVIGLGIGIFGSNMNDKAKEKSASTCKKCKKSMEGCYYEAKTDAPQVNVFDKCVVDVTFYAKCPHCGKENLFVDRVEIGKNSSARDLQDKIESLGKYYFGH